MELHVFIPSPSHFLPARTTLISSTLVRQCPLILAQRGICRGRRRKRKRPPSLSPMLKTLVRQASSMVTLSPRLLPPPLDLIAEEFLGGADGGNGGKSGSWGSSGSGWWWWDGWGRRGSKRRLGFWLVVMVIGLSLVIVQGIEINQPLGISIGLGLGIGMMGLIEKLTRDYWVLGFCCFGVAVVVLLGLGLNKEVTSSAGKFLGGANQRIGRTRRRRRRRRRNGKRFLVFRK